MRFVEQEIESFATPPNPHVELGTECLADMLQALQVQTSNHSPLNVRDELTRDTRGRRHVELA